MASAVAASDEMTPNEPSRRTRAPGPSAVEPDVGDHRPEPVGDLVEVDDLLHRLAQRLVDQRDRADPAHRLLERRLGVGRVHPAGLETQERRHGLQVVLHPVVDLADRRVLGDQLAVAAPQVADVADQDQRADPLPVRPQRDRAHDQRHRGRRQLGVPVGATAEDRAQRLLVGALARRHQVAGQVGEHHAGEVAGQAQPPEGRQRVGAGVDDAPRPRRPAGTRRRPAVSPRGRCAGRPTGSGRARSSG